jgi:hypothetical protein
MSVRLKNMAAMFKSPGFVGKNGGKNNFGSREHVKTQERIAH